jgi:DNA-directed RNA polymerase specialized sigma24 family protein
MNTLNRIIQKEDFARILATLTPAALNMAALRLVGLTDTEIASILDCSRTNVSSTLALAKQRAAHLHPDLAHYVEGRRLPHGPRRPKDRTFDWSWISHEGD